MRTRRIVALVAVAFLYIGVATAQAAPAPGCAAKPAPTDPKYLHGIALPRYLAFVPTSLSIQDTQYLAWDEEQFPLWGGTGDSDESKRGKHWHLYGTLADSCGDPQKAWIGVAAAFKKAGWTQVSFFQGQPLLVLHFTQGGIDAWADVEVDQPPKVIMEVVEVTPLPVHVTLTPPAATPETVDPAKGDFPYLTPMHGSHFKGGRDEDTPMYMVQKDGPDELVASGSVVKAYDPPDGTSALEFVSIYDEALKKAGWTIVQERPTELIQAHYGKDGRSLWAYLHINTDGYDFSVGDEASLATQLSKDCHVALTGVLFDFNQATLKPESDAVLQQVLALMTKEPTLKLQIQGHTDNVGDDKYNQKLSEQRAAAVVTWLTQHGIAAARLSSSGFGRTRPVADNNTDDGRAKNRRVEIVNPACKSKGG